MDFNIENYDLDDLLGLFKLKYDFTYEELKQAKKMVLKTHPDKSHLPKEYFLFFSKAFRMVHSIYMVRSCNNTINTVDYETKNEEIDSISKFSKSSDFNERFNALFEKHHVSDSKGYGDWLKSNADIEEQTKQITNTELHEKIEAKKKYARNLVKNTNIRDMGEESYCNITDDVPEEGYGSSIFNKFQYEDLQKAHQQSVIPVTEEDMQCRPFYQNEQQLRHEREHQTIQPMNKIHAEEYIQLNNQQKGAEDISRTFKLLQQDEKIAKINKSIISEFMHIKM